jgi:ferredoxin
MSVRIVDRCITCGACVWECPTQAISPAAPRPVVREEACTECYGFFGESQCMVVCPADAINVNPESRQQLATRYATLHPQRRPQDTWIWRRLTVPRQPPASLDAF